MFRNSLFTIRNSIFIFIMLILTACTSMPTSEPDQVTLQVNWYHEAEFAGYYVAEEQGFYADENIEVDILEGGLGIGANQRVLKKEADFAVTTFNGQRSMLEEDEPATTVMIGFQIPPAVLFALTDSGIQKPEDMIGQKVAIKAKYWRRMIHDTLTNAGVDPEEIIEVETDYDAINMLYEGEVDVWTGYAHDEPVEAELAGYDVNLIFPADYGVGVYEGLLIVHNDLLEQNPDLVDRFVRASLRGWQYAVEHPEETTKILAKWQPDESPEFHREAFQTVIPLVDTPDVPIGWIDAERWRIGMGDAYSTERPGYTLEFVERK
jgi:NitT/TauT family transport system substrate-binding protein